MSLNSYLNVFGLPAHPLIVHATVVMVPLAAVLVLGSACWPRLRRWAGYLTPVVAAIALVLVPASSHTGEQLRARLPETALIARHAQLADGLLPWAFGLFVASIVTTVIYRRERAAAAPAVTPAAHDTAEGDVLVRQRAAVATARRTPVALSVAAVVLAILTAAGTVVQVVRIGDSGAKAAWHTVPRTPLPGAPQG